MALCYSCMHTVPADAGVCPTCHSALPYIPSDSRDLPPGTVLQSRFIVGKALGHGGFGITYLAYDRRLQILRAIKEFFPLKAGCMRNDKLELVVSSQSMPIVNQHKGRFLHEAQMMSIASLNHIKNVVQIIDQFDQFNTSYIVMEYLDGCTLDEYMSRTGKGALPWDEAVRISHIVLNSLDELHQHDVIHRDVSMSNIFRLQNGEIRLIDFGCAGRISYQQKNPEEFSRAVKAGYSPYEQINNLPQGAYTDIYAYGVTLFKMIVGGIPQNLGGGALPSAIKAAPNKDIPIWLDAAIQKATQRDPRNRFRTAREFDMALEKHRGKSKQKKGKKALIPGIIAAVLIIVIGGALINSNSNPPEPTAEPVTNTTITPVVTPTPTPTATPIITEPPTQPPTLPTPEAAPEGWTGDAVYYVNDNGSDIGDLQFKLVDLHYLDASYCTGVFDKQTVRALSDFCLDCNIDFDQQTLSPELRYAVSYYAKHSALPLVSGAYALKPLTDEHRRLLAPLVNLTMTLSPAPNASGYIGRTGMLSLSGLGSPNKSLRLDINKKASFAPSTNSEGAWRLDCSSDSLIENASNEITLCYDSDTDKSVTISFIYKPESAAINVFSELKEGVNAIRGSAESLSTVALSINGSEVRKTTATSQGDFAFLDIRLKPNDILHITATDSAGNSTEWSGTVAEEERLPLTLEFKDTPDQKTATIGSQLNLAGKAQSGTTVEVLIDDMVVDTETIAGNDKRLITWGTTISTAGYINASAHTVTARYSDGKGNEASLRFILDVHCDEAILNDTVNEETTSLTGLAEPNATILLTDGKAEYTAVADANGVFKLDFKPFAPDTKLSLIVKDTFGNQAASILTVTSQAWRAIAIDTGDLVRGMYLNDNMLPYHIRGTAQPNKELLTAIDGLALGTVRTDAQGSWSVVMNRQHMVEGTRMYFTARYADGRGDTATAELFYDNGCETPQLSGVLDTDSVTLTGVCEANAEISLYNEANSLLGSTVADIDGRFSLRLPDKLTAGMKFTLTGVDRANNSASTVVEVLSKLPIYIGGLEHPVNGYESTRVVGIKAWMLCADNVVGKIIIEDNKGTQQQLTMSTYSSADFDELLAEHPNQVNASTGWWIKTNFNMEDYALPAGDYTVSLYADVDGEAEPHLIDSRRFVYNAESSVDEEDIDRTYDKVMDDELGYAFGFDKLLANAFNPSTIVLTAYSYTPENATVSVNFAIDGVDYSTREMSKSLGGQPKYDYVERKGDTAVLKSLVGFELNYEKAGMIITLPLSKLDDGVHVFTPTVMITSTDNATKIYTLKDIRITVDSGEKKFDVRNFKKNWQP